MVLLYHYKVCFESSGFIGVDIFFVLSGFLISNILLIGFPNKNIDILDFWKKRVLRLFPDSFILLFFIILWNSNNS